MDNAMRQDITLPDFSSGILRGIVAVVKGVDELRAWRLDDLRAHAAAAEVFRRLEYVHGCQYDLRFRIYTGADGRSGDWATAVSNERYLYCTIQDLAGNGDYDILPQVNDLMRWIHRDRAVGTVELWQQCARRFMHEYRAYTE